MEEKKIETCCKKTSIGGQALIEGIMMRGPKTTALAVRNPKGEIVVEEFETKGVKRPKFCSWPIIRGIFGYIDSMAIGYKALMRSAEISSLDEITKGKDAPAAEEKTEETASATAEEKPAKAEIKETDDGKIPAWVVTLLMVFSSVLGMALALFLFKFLPTQIFSWLTVPFPALQATGSAALDSLIKSAFEGVLKVILLVGYMASMALMKDMRRVFMYHGAEHKTIFCYEAKLPLTVENVRKQGRFHPRCGTSFLILMVLVNIFLSFFIDPITLLAFNVKLNAWQRTLVGLGLLPIVVGVGYELIKFAGRHDNSLTRVISAPGVWLQHVTVFEPTDDMIECAIASVERVIPGDESDNW